MNRLQPFICCPYSRCYFLNGFVDDTKQNFAAVVASSCGLKQLCSDQLVVLVADAVVDALMRMLLMYESVVVVGCSNVLVFD